MGGLRGPGRFNVDLSLRRTFPIKERLRLQLAADATNMLNHTELNGNFSGSFGSTTLSNSPAAGWIPGMGTSATFGTVGVGAFDPRQITMHLRVQF
ncbi:MAG TPA: hypothetical protein VKB88_19765 [Bryobacteraceae bacterium]|nr:hypothetical protein [Bryobacteraceae bacterium]